MKEIEPRLPFDAAIEKQIAEVLFAQTSIEEENFSKNQYRQLLTGRLFEEVTYRLLASDLSDQKRLLSPLETVEYYSYIYPEREILPVAFNMYTLGGIAVPDGLVFDRGWSGLLEEEALVTIYEYTTKTGDNFINTVYRKYKAYEGRREKYPDIFALSELVFVVPTFEEDKSSLDKARQVTRVIEFPFNHRNFRRYSFDFLNRYGKKK